MEYINVNELCVGMCQFTLMRLCVLTWSLELVARSYVVGHIEFYTVGIKPLICDQWCRNRGNKTIEQASILHLEIHTSFHVSPIDNDDLIFLHIFERKDEILLIHLIGI